MSYRGIRKRNYEYNYKHFPYLKSWKNPYTRFKAIVYVELGSVLTALFVRHNKKVDKAQKRLGFKEGDKIKYGDVKNRIRENMRREGWNI